MKKEKRLYAIEYGGQFYTNVRAYSSKDAIKRFAQGYPQAEIDKAAAYLEIEPKSRIEPEEKAFCEGYALTHPTKRKNGAALFYKDYRDAFPYSRRSDAALRNMRFLPTDFKLPEKPESKPKENARLDLLNFIETLDDPAPVQDHAETIGAKVDPLGCDPVIIQPETVNPAKVKAAIAEQITANYITLKNTPDGLILSFNWHKLSANARRRLYQVLVEGLAFDDFINFIEILAGGSNG